MKSIVFLREDFIDVSSYDQVGRALRQLTLKEKVLKIGYGLYAKVKTSTITGKIVPVKPLPTLAKEALRRLCVEVNPTKADLDYQESQISFIKSNKTYLSYHTNQMIPDYQDMKGHYNLNYPECVYQ